jgi:hypothetical protein
VKQTNYTGRNSLPGDLAVWDGHAATIVGNDTKIENQVSIGVQNDRRHGIASAIAICPSKPRSVAISR